MIWCSLEASGRNDSDGVPPPGGGGGTPKCHLLKLEVIGPDFFLLAFRCSSEKSWRVTNIGPINLKKGNQI